MTECVHKGSEEQVQFRLRNSLKERGQMNVREKEEGERKRQGEKMNDSVLKEARNSR